MTIVYWLIVGVSYAVFSLAMTKRFYEKIPHDWGDDEALGAACVYFIIWPIWHPIYWFYLLTKAIWDRV